MPPRLPAPQCLRFQNACLSQTTSRSFSSTISSQASTVTQKRKHRDPYAIAQAKARKTANLSRQEVLGQQRAIALGDPVHGETTPFIRSLDSGVSPEDLLVAEQSPAQTNIGDAKETTDEHLNFYVSKGELQTALKRSKLLTSPASSSAKSGSRDSQSSNQESNIDNPLRSLLESPSRDGQKGTHSSIAAEYLTSRETPEELAQKRELGQNTAEEAMRRISSLSLGNSKDRLRLNKQRIIDTFGRHNTDTTLQPKPLSSVTGDQPEKTPRVGPDTGSSEVQIGILTAKIRTLADFLQTRGRMDKVNKRNLRLLVHRRAKLLNYLRRKERGGPRWQNLIETLGLTEGTWKGEITM